MAKPKVFVSSTYYDLKYVRERLSLFLENMGFDPILFENGGIFFDYNSEIDESCYKEVKECHFMIIIVGRKYGSEIHEEKGLKKEGQRYTSIVRREYETAIANNIPVAVFVDKSVDVEYELYKGNKNELDKYDPPIKFQQVDNVGIFELIDLFQTSYIKKFDTIADIENHIRNQVSGMLYKYLSRLRKDKIDHRILSTMDDLKNLLSRK